MLFDAIKMQLNLVNEEVEASHLSSGGVWVLAFSTNTKYNSTNTLVVSGAQESAVFNV